MKTLTGGTINASVSICYSSKRDVVMHLDRPPALLSPPGGEGPEQ